MPTGQVRHVIKGGAFNTEPEIAAATFRTALPDDRRLLWNTGFRCARSAH
jgi:formylglycine-generating enzyme required for sulfatase activity